MQPIEVLPYIHLTENYLNNEELSQQGVLPTALFTILKTELDKINNIVMQEGALYSDKWGVAGQSRLYCRI